MDKYQQEMLASRRAAEALTTPQRDTVDQAEVRMRQRYAESAFNDSAESPMGAKGAFQIMPATYDEYSKKMGQTGDLTDPEYNGKMRDAIWDDLYNSFTATNRNPSDIIRTAKAAAMYNAGRGNIGKYLEAQKNKGVDIYRTLDWVEGLPQETKDYVKFVVLGKDIPGTSKTAKAYEAAKKKIGKK